MDAPRRRALWVLASCLLFPFYWAAITIALSVALEPPANEGHMAGIGYLVGLATLVLALGPLVITAVIAAWVGYGRFWRIAWGVALTPLALVLGYWTAELSTGPAPWNDEILGLILLPVLLPIPASLAIWAFLARKPAAPGPAARPSAPRDR